MFLTESESSNDSKALKKMKVINKRILQEKIGLT
jgi:hypothetical protein